MNSSAAEPASSPEENRSADAALQNAGAHGQRRSPLLLWAAVSVASVWLLFLGLLAWFTANPATLNIVQLRQADTIVVAKILEPRSGLIEIEQVLSSRLVEDLQPAQKLSVPLNEGHWQLNERRIIPLSQGQTALLEVTPIPSRKKTRLDYPADEALLHQLKDRLAQPVPALQAD